MERDQTTTTISVSKVTKAKFDELRPQGAASADEFLATLIDYYETGDAPEYAEGRVLTDDEVDEVITEIAERVEPEQGYVDDDKLARAVAAQIDYAQLANAVADEVEGRMR